MYRNNRSRNNLSDNNGMTRRGERPQPTSEELQAWTGDDLATRTLSAAKSFQDW